MLTITLVPPTANRFNRIRAVLPGKSLGDNISSSIKSGDNFNLHHHIHILIITKPVCFNETLFRSNNPQAIVKPLRQIAL
jgi:hypothetical protein